MSNDDFRLTNQERTCLRELARTYRGYAELPIMAERRRRWYEHNALRGRSPMLVMEYQSFVQGLLPPSHCTHHEAAWLEQKLRGAILNYELIGDDKVISPWIDIPWAIWIREFGIEASISHAQDSQGGSLGFAIEHPITDLERDIDRLAPSVFGVDRDLTLMRKQFAEEIFGDLLPVRISNESLRWYPSPCQKVINLMGMEAFMFALMDAPQHVERLFRFLREDILRFVTWQEDQGLLTLNNDNDYAGAGSYGFTNELPRTALGRSGKPRRQDLWVNLNSQETVTISPEMYQQFIFPWYRDIASHFGLTYYGCCEPVHAIWDQCVAMLPNLRKVSISRWCDEQVMGERLRGARVIYSRKPDPTLIGLEGFDAQAFREHIAATLRAARGCQLEFIFRDIYRLNGDRHRPGQAIRITRELVEQMWN